MSKPLQNKRGSHHAAEESGYEWAPIAGDDPRPLVPPGEYTLLCTDAERKMYPFYRRAAVVLSLRICEGPYQGIVLQRFYNVPADATIGRGSAYWREWTLANQGVPPRRRERMALAKFKGKLFTGEVVTVEVDRDGAALANAMYSKVARLTELLVTNEKISAAPVPMPLPSPMPTPHPPPTPGSAPTNRSHEKGMQQYDDSHT
jgi:hypothetical protein